MSGSRARLALLVAVVAGSLAAPARADDSAPVPPSAEAWYPSGTGTILAPLRPARTLHVGAAGGQETDRTYLAFDVSDVSEGEIDGVRLTVPVAVDDGTQAPATASILACQVSGTVVDGAGDEPPEADCAGAPRAAFVDGDAPAFTVELPPPADGLVQVALVPTGGDTWHVAFDSRAREGARPASVVVSSAPAASPTPPTPRPVPTAPPAPTAPDPGPPTAAPIAGDGPPLAVPDLTPEPVTPGQVVADEAAAPPGEVTVVPAGGSSPFRYPAVFALPLVLLVVLGLAGDGLTRPVRLPGDAP